MVELVLRWIFFIEGIPRYPCTFCNWFGLFTKDDPNQSDEVVFDDRFNCISSALSVSDVSISTNDYPLGWNDGTNVLGSFFKF